MIGRSLLDVAGVNVADRASMCVVIAGEVEPEGLGDDAWIPLEGRAEVLAFSAEGEPEVLAEAVRLVRDQLDHGEMMLDRGERPTVSWAQALVVLTKAQQVTARGRSRVDRQLRTAPEVHGMDDEQRIAEIARETEVEHAGLNEPVPGCWCKGCRETRGANPDGSPADN